ncbi:MAG: hypothetical protein J6P03_07860 [Opitutales bacterium]|nr:hypothetical protein [Opitutales bacterium]
MKKDLDYILKMAVEIICKVTEDPAKADLRNIFLRRTTRMLEYLYMQGNEETKEMVIYIAKKLESFL